MNLLTENKYFLFFFATQTYIEIAFNRNTI